MDSLIYQLPKIIDEGKKEVEKILERLSGSNKLSLQTNELVLPSKAINNLKKETQTYFGEPVEIPLITGSGLDVDLYKQYADFIITGTQLKKNKYWENEVDEENVKMLVEKMKKTLISILIKCHLTFGKN